MLHSAALLILSPFPDHRTYAQSGACGKYCVATYFRGSLPWSRAVTGPQRRVLLSFCDVLQLFVTVAASSSCQVWRDALALATLVGAWRYGHPSRLSCCSPFACAGGRTS